MTRDLLAPTAAAADPEPPLALRGPRVLLRRWRADDLGALAGWLVGAQPWRQVEAPFLTATPADAAGELARAAGELVAPSAPAAELAVEVGGELLGQVTSYWRSQATRWMRIGVRLYPAGCWGRGLGGEALALWIDYLFAARPDLVRLGMTTWSGHHGMVRLAHRLGFREEARHRKARAFGGVDHDALGFGLLREEWRSPLARG